jgi:Arc/MetJ-type ribon-helix-helix transcriptional regulator
VTIELKPEQERIIQEEIQSGHFRSAEEVLDNALAALLEKARQPKSLVQFFRQSPFVGMEMKFDRSLDTGRKIEL